MYDKPERRSLTYTSSSRRISRSRSSILPAQTSKIATKVNDPDSPGYNIKVYVRCRSRNKREIGEKSSVVISTMGAQGRDVILSNPSSSSSGSLTNVKKTYTFDRVFGAESDQEVVFNSVAKNYISEMLQGYNCTVFAYGQTGTGKTYTMSGDINILGSTTHNHDQSSILLSEHAGIIPRVLVDLFKDLKNESTDYSVKVSFLELYNERLKDLLADSNKEDDNNAESIRIFDNIKPEKNTQGSHSIMVKGMEEIYIKSAQEGLKLLTEGSIKRQVASTKCNDLSSRSHTVFTITTNVTKVDPLSGEEYVKNGKLNLVDLAGSENINRSGAENKRAQEAGLINKSLLTLGRVINALVDHSQHIPYRESKLTRLLQDSLGGKTKTCIIATVSPAKISMEETVSTLEYATRAKSIKNTPQINQSMTKDSCITEYIHEIDRLRKELRATRTKDGIYITQEKYDLYESNCILVGEQKARIDNLEEQIKRFKEKYVQQVNITKETEQKLQKIDLLYQQVWEKKQLLESSLDHLQQKCNSFEHEITEIHHKNLKILDSIVDERDTISEDLVQKYRYITETDHCITKELTTLKNVKKTLNNYNKSFKGVLKSVFQELQDKVINLSAVSEEQVRVVDTEGIINSFEDLNTSITKCIGKLKVKIDFKDLLLDETSEVVQSWISDLTKQHEALQDNLVRSIGELQKEISARFEFTETTSKKSAELNLEVLEAEKIKVKNLENNLQRARIDKENSDNLLQTLQTYFQDEVTRTRREIFKDITNAVNFGEGRLKELELNILQNSTKLVSDSQKDSNLKHENSLSQLGKTASSAFEEVCKATEKSNAEHVDNLKILQTSVINSIVEIPVKQEFSKYQEVLSDGWKNNVSEKVSSKIYQVSKSLEESSSIMYGNMIDETARSRGIISDLVEKQNHSIGMMKSQVSSLSKYIFNEYKNNVDQIATSQDEIVEGQAKALDGVAKALSENTSKVLPQEPLSVTIDPRQAIRALPQMDKTKNLQIYRDQDLSSIEKRHPNRSPEHPTSTIVGNPSTPMPIPDQPLTKVLVPKSVNSSTKRSKTLPVELRTNEKGNNLKRKFMSEPDVIQEGIENIEDHKFKKGHA